MVGLVTLILAFVDPNCLIQVADQRISWRYSDGRRETRDDHTIKQVLIHGSTLVSFTGVARVEGMPTDRWIAKQFEGHAGELDAALPALADVLTRIFARHQYRDEGLILTFTGWAKNESGVLSPFVASVRNLEVEPSFARMAEFKWARRPNLTLAGWVAEGQSLPQNVRATLQRRLARGLRAGISAEVVMDLFLQAMRETAQKNKWVGPTALIGILPRSAAEYANTHGGEYYFAESMQGALWPGMPMFLRVAEGQTRPVRVRPRIV